MCSYVPIFPSHTQDHRKFLKQTAKLAEEVRIQSINHNRNCTGAVQGSALLSSPAAAFPSLCEAGPVAVALVGRPKIAPHSTHTGYRLSHSPVVYSGADTLTTTCSNCCTIAQLQLTCQTATPRFAVVRSAASSMSLTCLSPNPLWG